MNLKTNALSAFDFLALFSSIQNAVNRPVLPPYFPSFIPDSDLSRLLKFPQFAASPYVVLPPVIIRETPAAPAAADIVRTLLESRFFRYHNESAPSQNIPRQTVKSQQNAPDNDFLLNAFGYTPLFSAGQGSGSLPSIIYKAAVNADLFLSGINETLSNNEITPASVVSQFHYFTSGSSVLPSFNYPALYKATHNLAIASGLNNHFYELPQKSAGGFLPALNRDITAPADSDIDFFDAARQSRSHAYNPAPVQVSVSLGGVTNNVSSDLDLEDFVRYLADNVAEAIRVTAERSHL